MDTLPRRGTLRARALASASTRQSGVVRLKLMVLGSTSVGKSSIISRFNADAEAAEGAPQRRGAASASAAPLSSFSAASALGSVSAFSPGYVPTVGVSFVPASVSSYRPSSSAKSPPLRVQSNFFDFSGEFASYAKVRAEFLGDCSGLAICFDLTNKRSWEAVEEWYTEATSVAAAAAAAAGQSASNTGLHAIIVGCKSDLLDAGSTRAVPESTVKAWCKSKGASYFECSAKTGQGVTKAIAYLIEHAQASGAPQQQQPQSAQPPPQQQRPPSGSPHHSPQRSPPSASSASASASASATANISDLSVGELRRECAKRGINTDDCLEKSEVLTRLREALARERASKIAEANENASRDERSKEAVLADVARWARGKDIRAMLNDIHGWTEGTSANYLDRHASLAPVQIAYKKALLRIHPDKVDASSESHVHLRATEMFKTVNAAFEAFKKTNEKRSSGNPGAMDVSASAAAPAPSPTGSPTPRTRPAQGRR